MFTHQKDFDYSVIIDNSYTQIAYYKSNGQSCYNISLGFPITTFGQLKFRDSILQNFTDFKEICNFYSKKEPMYIQFKQFIRYRNKFKISKFPEDKLLNAVIATETFLHNQTQKDDYKEKAISERFEKLIRYYDEYYYAYELHNYYRDLRHKIVHKGILCTFNSKDESYFDNLFISFANYFFKYKSKFKSNYYFCDFLEDILEDRIKAYTNLKAIFKDINVHFNKKYKVSGIIYKNNQNFSKFKGQFYIEDKKDIIDSKLFIVTNKKYALKNQYTGADTYLIQFKLHNKLIETKRHLFFPFGKLDRQEIRLNIFSENIN